MMMDITALYTTHRAALVRMVTAVTGDADMAEGVCQDAFVGVLSGEHNPACGDDPVRWLYHMARRLGEQALRGRREARQAPLSDCHVVNDSDGRWTDPPPQAALLDDLPAHWRNRARSPDARLLAHGDGVCAALYGGRCPCLSVFRPPHAPGALTRSGPARQAAAEPGALMPPGATAV